MVSNKLLVDSRLQELKTGCVERCGQGVMKDVLSVLFVFMKSVVRINLQVVLFRVFCV